MKIGIIGSGVFALSLAINLNTSDISIWVPSMDERDLLDTTRRHKDLKDIILPNYLNFSNDLESVMKDKDLIIIATSIVYIEDTLKRIKEYDNNYTYLFATKGILDNGTLISEYYKNIFNNDNIAFIGGGTFAIDLANLSDTALTIAASDDQVINKVKNAFKSNLIFDYTNDVKGIQICSFYKNIMAIYIGYCDNMNFTKSKTSMIFKDLIDNLRSILKELDCNPDTVNLYCGIADIFLTCTSYKSRNYTFGKMIATNMDVNTFLNNNTVEGYNSLIGINKRIDNKMLKDIDSIIKRVI